MSSATESQDGFQISTMRRTKDAIVDPSPSQHDRLTDCHAAIKKMQTKGKNEGCTEIRRQSINLELAEWLVAMNGMNAAMEVGGWAPPFPT